MVVLLRTALGGCAVPPRLARLAGRAADYRGATAYPGQLRPHRAPVARGATETGRGPVTRADDLVRTERYFCALLLSLLIDEASAGVRALVELLVEKGILRTGLADAPISPETTQVIAELAVRRDVQKHSPGEQSPPTRRGTWWTSSSSPAGS